MRFISVSILIQNKGTAMGTKYTPANVIFIIVTAEKIKKK